jgi:coenzyme PQQ precursor peptide PqqA
MVLFGLQKPFCGFVKSNKEGSMTWTTPTVTEVCVGMEVTTYAPAKA